MSAQIEALERCVFETERTQHELVESFRYVLEAGGQALVASGERERGHDLHDAGHLLPYLLSGRRSWNGPTFPESTVSTIDTAQALANKYGFALPCSGVLSVAAMLDLAMALLHPPYSTPLKGLQQLYPVIPERQTASASN